MNAQQPPIPPSRELLRQLEGHKLDDEWVVGQHIPKRDGDTGGFFSEGYTCAHTNGTSAYFKAIDLHEALNAEDFLRELNKLTDAVLCEQELLEKCRTMDRVVKALTFGTIKEIGGRRLVIPIPYIIFERATESVRAAVSREIRPSHAWCIKTLQHVATGMSQLHRARIAHQDLKLSNALHFPDLSVVKIADLGRSVSQGRPVFYDQYQWPGDNAYAPPEVAYGFEQSEFDARRFSTDLYLLGSFACALFTGVPLNALLYGRLPPDFRPQMFRGPYQGTFENVKAHLSAAFEEVLREIRQSIDPEAPYADEVVLYIGQWAAPDPRDRGHPITRSHHAGVGNIFDLARYLSPLANLESHARAFEHRKRGQ